MSWAFRFALVCLFMAVLVITGNHGLWAGSESLPDPTEPPGGYEESVQPKYEETKPSWKVESILHSGNRRLAVINGQIIHVGQSVSGGTVTAITETGVTIQYRGKHFTVRVIPEGISTKTGSNAREESRP